MPTQNRDFCFVLSSDLASQNTGMSSVPYFPSSFKIDPHKLRMAVPLPRQRGILIEDTEVARHLPLDSWKQLGLGEEEASAGSLGGLCPLPGGSLPPAWGTGFCTWRLRRGRSRPELEEGRQPRLAEETQEHADLEHVHFPTHPRDSCPWLQPRCPV